MADAIFDYEELDTRTENPWRNRGAGKYTVYMQDDDEFTCGFCAILNAVMQIDGRRMYKDSYRLYSPEDIRQWAPYIYFNEHRGMMFDDCLGFAKETFFPGARMTKTEDASEFRKGIKRSVKACKKVIAAVNWTNADGGHLVLIANHTSRTGRQRDLFTVIDSLDSSGGVQNVQLKVENVRNQRTEKIAYSHQRGGLTGYFETSGYIALGSNSMQRPRWL